MQTLQSSTDLSTHSLSLIHDLPVELWQPILSNFSVPQLRKMALVNRFFKHQCQPLIDRVKYQYAVHLNVLNGLGRRYNSLHFKGNNIKAIRFSQDGTKLATWSKTTDGQGQGALSLQYWDVSQDKTTVEHYMDSDGKPLPQIPLTPSEIEDGDFPPLQSAAAINSSIVELCRLKLGITKKEDENIDLKACFSRDNKKVAILINTYRTLVSSFGSQTYWTKSSITFWEIEKGDVTLLSTIKSGSSYQGHLSRIVSAVFTPSGERVLLGVVSYKPHWHTIELRNFYNGEFCCSLRNLYDGEFRQSHQERISEDTEQSLIFSPDGSKLAIVRNHTDDQGSYDTVKSQSISFRSFASLQSLSNPPNYVNELTRLKVTHLPVERLLEEL